MKSIFRSRLPPALTPAQIDSLSKQSRLEVEDIEEWYERFNHCYPRGYLSLKEFFNYLQQLNIVKRTDYRPTKSMAKQLFRILDLNEDKQLNFEEFFLFNTFMNNGSSKEKLKLILSLYDQNKTKYLTREQLEDVLNNMFDILNIPKPKNGLSKTIENILIRTNFSTQDTKIGWNTFSTYILNDPSLFQLLISNDDNEDDEPEWLITRF